MFRAVCKLTAAFTFGWIVASVLFVVWAGREVSKNMAVIR